MEKMLIFLIKRAKLVIIGRMTPQQKAQICTIARKHMKAKIMAMGDGQNDSPMIQVADIGVRIISSKDSNSEQQADICI